MSTGSVHTNPTRNSFYNWIKILSLKKGLFDLKMMMKSSLEFLSLPSGIGRVELLRTEITGLFFRVVHLSFFRILKLLCYFGTYGCITPTIFLRMLLANCLTKFFDKIFWHIFWRIFSRILIFLKIFFDL